ncbi:AP2-like ethylene-responsive transcription factor AIL7 [Cryptomeria japonica]|uniref:AP2-like ethylene-responsive transcription factor AIL7 n=1 Tax=Cryptomeria japonica TaxID=3369 RepID=UPI0025AC68EA|nr:AP2-like ethylene-responsive transcription factor AIL7 [Cryptomeria japonica]
MKNMSKRGYIEVIGSSSTGFSRRRSAYRGVSRHNHDGKWQARFGRFDGKKDLYLGTFTNEEDAAKAYDIAAIKLRGENAFTNFDKSSYDVKAIMSGTLTVGRKPKRARLALEDKESNGDIDDFPYNPLSFEPATNNVESTANKSSCTSCMAPTTINGQAISKTIAGAHELVMGGYSLPSHISLSPFSYTQERLVVPNAPSFENMLSLGTSTFCFPGQSSDLVRAGHQSIMPDTNWKTLSLQHSESGPSRGGAVQPTIMFNIWSDIRKAISLQDSESGPNAGEACQPSIMFNM